MKKIFSVLVMFLLVFSSFANNPIKNSKNYELIKVTINKKTKEYKKSYKSEKDLNNSSFEDFFNLIEKDFKKELLKSECTIHVSITVSVGYDSSYTSMTVSGDFPCDTWKEDARKLKKDAKELLME